MKRTIIMLSAKRCGSTAIFNSFQKHPQVNICNDNQKISNHEIQFWTSAVKALNGDISVLSKILKDSFPSLNCENFLGPDLSKKKIFDLWNYILENKGPILFDKSPQYLSSKSALDLIFEYKSLGHDVKIFSLIRDPKDAITSQYELWKEYTKEQNLNEREQDWLNKYKNLELLNKFHDIPLFYYEKIANNPEHYFSKIYDYCNIKFYRESFSHFKKVSINRYNLTFNKKVTSWNWSIEFENHLKKYNYSKLENHNIIKKVFFNLKNFKRFIPLRIKNFLRKIIDF